MNLLTTISTPKPRTKKVRHHTKRKVKIIRGSTRSAINNRLAPAFANTR